LILLFRYSNVKSDKELLKEQQERERVLALLPERKRRTYLRQLERGEAPPLSLIQDLKDDDFDDFSDEDESEPTS
jgi:hypothetical protein